MRISTNLQSSVRDLVSAADGPMRFEDDSRHLQ